MLILRDTYIVHGLSINLFISLFILNTSEYDRGLLLRYDRPIGLSVSLIVFLNLGRIPFNCVYLDYFSPLVLKVRALKHFAFEEFQLTLNDRNGLYQYLLNEIVGGIKTKACRGATLQDTRSQCTFDYSIES